MEVKANMPVIPRCESRAGGIRRSFAASELSKKEINALAATRMEPKHDHLNALLLGD